MRREVLMLMCGDVTNREEWMLESWEGGTALMLFMTESSQSAEQMIKDVQ